MFFGPGVHVRRPENMNRFAFFGKDEWTQGLRQVFWTIARPLNANYEEIVWHCWSSWLNIPQFLSWHDSAVHGELAEVNVVSHSCNVIIVIAYRVPGGWEGRATCTWGVSFTLHQCVETQRFYEMHEGQTLALESRNGLQILNPAGHGGCLFPRLLIISNCFLPRSPPAVLSFKLFDTFWCSGSFVLWISLLFSYPKWA